MNQTSNLSRNITVLFSGAMLAASVACAPENPRLMPPPVKYEVAQSQSKPIVMKISPKVDVLVVMDNSSSMADEQETLSANIDRFANSLAKNGNVDFHIGVTTVWDTPMFKDMPKPYTKGELRHLNLRTKDGIEKLPDSFTRFVDSKANYDAYLAEKGIETKSKAGWLQVLSASMKIGVESYNKNWATEKTGGPENEEIFAPVKTVLSADAPAANAGFRRRDAHLVIVFITDADGGIRNPDGQMYDITGGDLQDFLSSQEQFGQEYKDKVSVMAVLAKGTDDVKERDPVIQGNGKNEKATDPVNLQSFVSAMGGRPMHLRSKKYGDEMAEFGDYVRSRTLSSPKIGLDHKFELSTLRVSLNGDELSFGDGAKDFASYDVDSNSVVIKKDLSQISGALDIKVSYTPILASSVTSGRITRPGQTTGQAAPAPAASN